METFDAGVQRIDGEAQHRPWGAPRRHLGDRADQGDRAALTRDFTLTPGASLLDDARER